MVKYSEAALDRTFGALADPTRRAMLTMLQRGSHSVSALAQPFSISLPAVMKHLDVLADAGLISRKKEGRIVACTLRAEPMQHATHWLRRYERLWDDSLDRLDGYLKTMQRGGTDGNRRTRS